MRQRSQGFTLIEVLVALVVVAFGIGALMASLTSAADTVARLRDKSLAEWVALNRVTETRIQTGGLAQKTGSSSGEVEYANEKWRWEQEIKTSELPGVMQIDVHVRRASVPKNEKGGWLAEATGFLGTTFSRPQPSSPNWDELPEQSSGDGVIGEGGSAGGGGGGGGGAGGSGNMSGGGLGQQSNPNPRPRPASDPSLP